MSSGGDTVPGANMNCVIAYSVLSLSLSFLIIFFATVSDLNFSV